MYIGIIIFGVLFELAFLGLAWNVLVGLVVTAALLIVTGVIRNDRPPGANVKKHIEDVDAVV